MKKRILCLLVALLLCLSMVFVSCNDDTTLDDDNTPPVTDTDGKKGEIEVKPSGTDATLNEGGQKTDGFSKPE